MDDLTNRIMAVAFAFLWIFAIFVIILLVWSAPDESIGRIRDLAGYLDDHNNTEAQLIITFGGVILMLLAVLLVIFELVPPEGGDLKIQQSVSGDTVINAEDVVRMVEEALREVPYIEDAEAKIVGRGKKADVHLDLHVAPEANLASTADAASQRVTEILQAQMGIGLAKAPTAEVHYRELQVAGTAIAPSPPAPTNPAPEAGSSPATEAASSMPESTDAPREGPTPGS